MIDNEHPMCPTCKTTMVKVGNPLMEEQQQWACPKQILFALSKPGDPVLSYGHRVRDRISVWDESRLDAWHSPA